MNGLGLGYWWALLLVPLIIGLTGVVLERTLLQQALQAGPSLWPAADLRRSALIIEGIFRNEFGSSGLPYRIPPELSGAWNLGFMFLPIYRAWVVVASLIVCVATWF